MNRAAVIIAAKLKPGISTDGTKVNCILYLAQK